MQAGNEPKLSLSHDFVRTPWIACTRPCMHTFFLMRGKNLRHLATAIQGDLKVDGRAIEEDQGQVTGIVLFHQLLPETLQVRHQAMHTRLRGGNAVPNATKPRFPCIWLRSGSAGLHEASSLRSSRRQVLR